MTKRRSKHIWIGLWVLAFLAIWALNALTPLLADDYSYMYSFATGERVTSLGQFFASAKAHYTLMNGRIFTHVLMGHGAALMGKGLFNILNTLVFLAFVYGLYRLAGSPKKYDWLLLLALFASVFLVVPVFGATILWVSGALSYLWGVTLILYAILPFADALVRHRKTSIGMLVLYGVIGFLAGTASENTSLAMLALMGLCVLWVIVTQKRIPVDLLALTLAAALGYLFMMGARFARGDMAASQVTSGLVLRFGECMKRLLSQGGLLCVLSGLFVYAAHSSTDKDRLAFVAIVCASALIANVAMIASPYYPQRADFGWTVLLLLACFILATAQQSPRFQLLWQGAVACLAVMAAVQFLCALPSNYDRYCQAQAQMAQVLTQREAGQLDVAVFGVKSASSYDAYCDGNLFSADPEYLPNRCFAKEYGLDSFVLTMEQY